MSPGRAASAIESHRGFDTCRGESVVRRDHRLLEQLEWSPTLLPIVEGQERIEGRTKVGLPDGDRLRNHGPTPSKEQPVR